MGIRNKVATPTWLRHQTSLYNLSLYRSIHVGCRDGGGQWRFHLDGINSDDSVMLLFDHEDDAKLLFARIVSAIACGQRLVESVF